MAHGLCWNCDEPVSVNGGGWYHCRFCGFQSVQGNMWELAAPDAGCERAPASERAGSGAGLVSLIDKVDGLDSSGQLSLPGFV